jgi:hypothetical protein
MSKPTCDGHDINYDNCLLMFDGFASFFSLHRYWVLLDIHSYQMQRFIMSLQTDLF